MKNKIDDKVKNTMEFYDKYPLANGRFREGISILKMENIQVDFKELENKLILDCGCGPGNTSMKILKSVNNPYLVSMDLSLNSLKILKKRQKEHENESNNVQLQGNVLKIPFNKNSFDFIIAAGVVHHTPEPFKSLDNLYTVLKKTGGMYFSVYNKNSFYFLEFYTVGTVFRFFYKKKMKNLLNISISWFRILLITINSRPISEINARKIFADRYLTPVASFHTKGQIRKWSGRNNATIVKTGKCKLGTLIWFRVKKEACK